MDALAIAGIARMADPHTSLSGRVVAIVLTLFGVYMALSPGPFYVKGAMGTPVHPRARPIPGWLGRLAMLPWTLAAGYMALEGWAFREPAVNRGFEIVVFLVCLFWFFLALGAVYAESTPGPTFSGEQHNPTVRARRIYRVVALLMGTLGLYLFTTWLLRLIMS